MSETMSIVLQGGAVAVLLLGFAALLRGDIRTRQEVESIQGVCQAKDGEILWLRELNKDLRVTLQEQVGVNEVLADAKRRP